MNERDDLLRNLADLAALGRGAPVVRVDLSDLAGVVCCATERTPLRVARVVPAQGLPYDHPLDGTPLRPGAVLRVYVHAEVLRLLVEREAA